MGTAANPCNLFPSARVTAAVGCSAKAGPKVKFSAAEKVRSVSEDVQILNHGLIPEQE